MLEVDNVTFSYSKRAEQNVAAALREVSLRIDAGETVAIIGQNGSGKSTLARLLAGLLQPTSGSIQIDGLPTTVGGEAMWTIHQRVGIVFQNPDDQLVANTVIDDIAFGPENLGLPRFEIEERVQEAMALLQLEPYAQMAISELSVGQKQRVAIAGVLAMRPRYLLLDEPTTMLSGHTAQHMLKTALRLSRERGITILHITHFMHELTAFERVIVMDAGRVLMDGTPADVFAHGDELRAVGLDVPAVTRLGSYMKAHGWRELPDVILTAEQLKDAVLMQQTRIADTSTIEDKTTDDRATGDRSRITDDRATARVAPTIPDHIATSEEDDEAAENATIKDELTVKPVSTLQDDRIQVGDVQARPLIELRDVRYTHLRDTPFAVEALKGVSLSVFEGQALALVGPTKAGKSTVVDMLAGLIKPAVGSLFLEELEVNTPARIERLRSNVGVVFQSPESQIFEDTVGKDVSFGPLLKKVPLAESRRLVRESLEAVGLSYEDFRTRYTYALSGGEKRRVAIAGVLALQPRVIVFDEPAAGLDPRGRRELLALLKQLKQARNLTIVYTSSSLDDVIGLADIFYVIDQGRIVLHGTAREILARSSELATRDIALPEAAHIALSLREAIPALPADVLRLEDLEAAIGYPRDRLVEVQADD
ncbi:MAG TPA: energy-coupling factor transporter ATPase [Ktedonobacteraceae bacterium]|nr:energy-coupling factor transporter ATPase [Ktedonobacteraceae bacterium]